MNKVFLFAVTCSAIVLYATDIDPKLPAYQDNHQHLLWQDQAYTPQEQVAYDADTNRGKVGDWNYANSYCQNLKIDNYTEWRLPKIGELYQSYKKRYSFRHSNQHSYWSSTAEKSEGAQHYALYFRTGDIEALDDVVHYYIRCVHDINQTATIQKKEAKLDSKE